MKDDSTWMLPHTRAQWIDAATIAGNMVAIYQVGYFFLANLYVYPRIKELALWLVIFVVFNLAMEGVRRWMLPVKKHQPRSRICSRHAKQQNL